MLITPQYPVSPGTMARNASTAEHPYFFHDAQSCYIPSVALLKNLVGNSYPLDIQSTVELPTTKYGTAIDCDGAALDYFARATQPTGLGSLTYNVWFRADAVGSTVYLCGTQNGGSDGGRYLRLNASSQLQFEVAGDAIDAANGGTTLVTGSWYLGTGVKDAAKDEIRLYLNGISDATPVSTSGVTYAADLTNWHIGSRPDFPDTLEFDGQISFVSVHKRAWNANEVRDFYRATVRDHREILRRKPLSIPYAPAAAAAGGGAPMLTLLRVG